MFQHFAVDSSTVETTGAVVPCNGVDRRMDRRSSRTYLGWVAGLVAVELAGAPLQDLRGAPAGPGATSRRGRGARAHGGLGQRRLGPRAVLGRARHRRREGRRGNLGGALEVQLAAELPDPGLKQIEAVHERAPHVARVLRLLLLERRRHGLAVLVARRRVRAAAGAVVLGDRGRPPLLLQLPQLPAINKNALQWGPATRTRGGTRAMANWQCGV